MFNQLRPLLRVANALEQIAAALTYFAVSDARENGRMFMPKKPGWTLRKDESELMHTNLSEIERIRAEEQAIISNRGFAYLDDLESKDE